MEALGVSALNAMDLERDTKRLSQSRGGISSDNTHAPVGHMRQRGHIDNLSQRAGGDTRQRVLNNNNVARRKRDNDPINIDRPLG